MPSWRFVGSRVLFAILAIYLVVSLTFAFLVFVPDPGRARAALGAAMGGGDTEKALSAYDAIRGRDEPLLDRYVAWIVGVTTFDFSTGDRWAPDDVKGALWEHGRVTLLYLVPALVFSSVVGLLFGALVGLSNNRWVDAVGSRLVYLGGSIPVFLSLAVVYAFFRYKVQVLTPYDTALSPLAWPNLRLLGIASVVLTVSLVSVQMRYARAEALSYSGSQMVKLVRAKGGGRSELFRHVGRLAALPLLSLFFSETLAAMYLSIYVVEVTLGVPGFGQFVYTAIENRTFSVILAATMVTIVIGVFGNLLQDVTYTVLDPRVEG